MDRAARWLVALVALVLALSTSSIQAQVQFPESRLDDSLSVGADRSNHWTLGSYEVWWLQGNVLINQGLTYARASEGIIWVERGGEKGDPPHKVIAYLEGEVSVDYQQGPDGVAGEKQPLKARVTDKTWLGRFETTAPLKLRLGISGPEPNPKPPIFDRGMAAREPKFRTPVRPAQFSDPGAPPAQPRPAPPLGPNVDTLPPPPGAAGVALPAVDPQGPPVGARRLRAFPRSDARVQLQWFPNPANSEWIGVVSSGVNLVVDGLDNFGSVDMAADRLVMWTNNTEEPLLGGDGTVQRQDTPLEIYMEGNIVFRQGDRTIYANRMYYDVRRQIGVIIQAELLSPVPNYDGALRLRAKVLEQLGPNSFVGQGASLTSSRLGVPTYDLRTGTLTYQDIQQPAINSITGQPVIGPNGEPVIEHRRQATARGNALYVGEVPLFYWPYLATDLEAPNYYVNGFQIRNDRIFGTQVFLDFNAYQLLGIKNKPEGTTWDISADYLSRRGPATGTSFTFDRPNLFGFGNRAYGMFDAWGLYDRGHDNLGLNRRDLTPERGPWRGRMLARDRWFITNDIRVTGEFSLIKDYNFLEQYFEQEWDQFKDQTTDLELKQQRDDHSWSAYTQVRLNDFFTETNWLPRLDHYMLGRSLFGDRVTWFEHSNAGYAQQLISQPPTNAADLAQFQYLPWEPHLNATTPNPSTQGIRSVTRQELDLPFTVANTKFVPYILGEAGYWGQSLNLSVPNEVSAAGGLMRGYGQAGVRTSIPFWSVNPAIQSQMFNVNGLAHKVSLEANVFASQSSQNLNRLPLDDLLDDQNIIRYRRIFPTYDTGGTMPLRYDERYYALRSGLGGDVTGPSEIAGNLLAAQLGLRQRWQTKRGMPGNQRVVDLMTFDMQGTIFPDANRDNFGTAVGQVQYNYRWFLGDRTTVVSDGYFDFFGGGPKYVSLGTYLNRPPRGSLYGGILFLEGPISSTVLVGSYNYRMSPKWVSTMGSTFALNKSGNIGQNFALTRIGESFLFSVGVNIDASKGNVGANISIEPRLLNKALSSAANGVLIPAAGAFGLE